MPEPHDPQEDVTTDPALPVLQPEEPPPPAQEWDVRRLSFPFVLEPTTSEARYFLHIWWMGANAGDILLVTEPDGSPGRYILGNIYGQPRAFGGGGLFTVCTRIAPPA